MRVEQGFKILESQEDINDDDFESLEYFIEHTAYNDTSYIAQKREDHGVFFSNLPISSLETAIEIAKALNK